MRGEGLFPLRVLEGDQVARLGVHHGLPGLLPGGAVELVGAGEGVAVEGEEHVVLADVFDVDAALEKDSYVRERRALLDKYHLKCLAISTHLVGQCVADNPIDERHKSILPGRIWGDGKPEGVRQRAAEEVKNTARAAAKFGVKVVNGFTGSKIWAFGAMSISSSCSATRKRCSLLLTTIGAMAPARPERRSSVSCSRSSASCTEPLIR